MWWLSSGVNAVALYKLSMPQGENENHMTSDDIIHHFPGGK